MIVVDCPGKVFEFQGCEKWKQGNVRIFVP